MNQRILEDLQIKKQLLQGATASAGQSVVIPQYMQMSVSEPTATAPLAALSNQQTFGYFINQDSAFGNTILPVLPRYTK